MLGVPSRWVGCQFLVVVLVKACDSEMSMARCVRLCSRQGWGHSVVGEGTRIENYPSEMASSGLCSPE